jgi:hypothetical protein
LNRNCSKEVKTLPICSLPTEFKPELLPHYGRWRLPLLDAVGPDRFCLGRPLSEPSAASVHFLDLLLAVAGHDEDKALATSLDMGTLWLAFF